MLLSGVDNSSAQPVQSSSPRASSSSVSRQSSAPSYLSARSADVILSEVRPTRIKPDALRCVNIFLDELLWLILGYARSFDTERLRSGLLKVLPTALGKAALLEAEVELRAYIERNPQDTLFPTDDSALHKFPLQQAFEFLRAKCESYSSLGDQEENTDTEGILYSRMVQVQVAGDGMPPVAAVAPAALYLTAILEYVCEHVLSNVGRVVARDSSRTTAHAQDLYVALCEDETIYSLFKTMKVQEQIEQQSKVSRPRRSKSASRNDFGDQSTHGIGSDAPAVPKPRQSLDSAVSNGSNSNLPNRTSMEKARSKVTFKVSSQNGDSKNPLTADSKHRRSNSLISEKKNPLAVVEDADVSRDSQNEEYSPGDDDGSMQDFDDLMRSGTTMKVSLTPDRLKTFEVFAKEKNQRANRPGPQNSLTRDSTPPSSFPTTAPHLLHKPSQQTRNRSLVETIVETPEADNSGRSRAASISHPSKSNGEKAVPTPRSRSFTDARIPTSTAEFSNRRLDTLDTATSITMPVAVIDSSTDTPKRTRRQQTRNRESIDLDDIMDGSDDDLPAVKKNLLTPKSAQATGSGTRELMDFLSQGPPEPPPTVTTPSSPAFPDVRSAKQGRIRTIVSRLTGSSSRERLSSRVNDDSMDNYSRPAGINAGSVKTQSEVLHSKRSIPNVAATVRSATSTNYPDGNAFTSDLRARQLSVSRKAPPSWEPLKEGTEPIVPPRSPARQAEQLVSPMPRQFPSATSSSPSETRYENGSPVRKRAPQTEEQAHDKHAGKPAPTASSHPNPKVTNGHDSAMQEVARPPRGSSGSENTGGSSGMTFPTEAYIHNFRHLMAQATSAAECRVLSDMFLANCGALMRPGEPTPSLSTSHMFSALEADNSHEIGLIEVLLGDGALTGFPTTPEPTSPTPSAVQTKPMDTTGRHGLQPTLKANIDIPQSSVVTSAA